MRSHRSFLGVAGLLLAASLTAAGARAPVRSRSSSRCRSAPVSISPTAHHPPRAFIVVRQEGEGRIEGSNIDVQQEFQRYLLKILKRDTDLDIVESGPIDYPTYDLRMLARDAEFWRVIGERTQADLILVGSLDFDIQDRSGYRTEEYVSPFDGRTYYRQVLVEQTGFEYDIVVRVFDGQTGEQPTPTTSRTSRASRANAPTCWSACSRTCTRSRTACSASSCRREWRDAGSAEGVSAPCC